MSYFNSQHLYSCICYSVYYIECEDRKIHVSIHNLYRTSVIALAIIQVSKQGEKKV